MDMLRRSDRQALIQINGRNSVFLTREVEEHGDVLVSFAPGPGFREVVGVVEAKDEVMLVTVEGDLRLPAPSKSKLSSLISSESGTARMRGWLLVGNNGRCDALSPSML